MPSINLPTSCRAHTCDPQLEDIWCCPNTCPMFEPLLIGWITSASNKITDASNGPYDDGAHDQPLITWIVSPWGLTMLIEATTPSFCLEADASL
jgi:hypothetical protein